MDGIIIVDKPADMTSAKVVAAVKRILGVRKIGHTGTLDPFATGVLVCCVGQATRLARFFLHGTKRYEALLHLGVETDTQDHTGEVVAEIPCPELDRNQVTETFEAFLGETEQAPPVYSALKHQGTPLYKLARRGEPVQKPPRKITVHELNIREVTPPEIRFETVCSGGTYVRTLCADIGAKLGCGGHLAELRRTENSGFSVEEAHTLDELADLSGQGRAGEVVVSMNEALRHMPEYSAGPDLLGKISHGRQLAWRDLGHQGARATADQRPGNLKVVDADGNLAAVLEPAPDGLGLEYCCVFNTRG
ncbi:MAG: tRNA pseudouridine(55) synthase TruB [Desulfatibacillaceae bacterium]